MYFTPRRYKYRALDSDEHDVIVTGAGPVGLATALGLARRGVRVTLLEAGNSASYGSRAICLSRHSLEVLDRLGVGEAVSHQALPWTTGRSYYRDVEVLEFDMPYTAADPHPPMVNISQSAVEQILIDAALSEPSITIAWCHKLLFVTPDDEGDDGEGVGVTVDTPGGLHDIRARYLVGTDGARSTVRDDLGLRLKGTTFTGNYLTADIHWKAGLPAERRVWFDPPASPGQTVVMLRQPDDIWRVDFQLPPDADPAAELEPQRLGERIRTHLDWIGNAEPWTLEWSSCFVARAESMDSYVHGRVAFAGDAAHLVPVFGVRGLNSGLEDADTLAWALAAVAAGPADPALLRAYALERREAWRQNIAQASLSTLFMSPGNGGRREARDAVLALAPYRAELRELINPRQTSATHARTSPLSIPTPNGPAGSLVAGDPVPDLYLQVRGRRTSLHAERGPDFTLLAFGRQEAERLTGAAEVLGARLAPAVGVRVLVPDDGESVASALGGRPGEVLIIRPDGLLLGRFASPAALGEPEDLAVHILRGGARKMAGDQLGVVRDGGALDGAALDGTALDRKLSPAEEAWRAVSAGLDEAPAGEREAFLARLVLLLALEQPDPATVPRLVTEALAAGDKTDMSR
jgi:3-(3-hydroxy-phenyl)propionate hydroxylase